MTQPDGEVTRTLRPGVDQAYRETVQQLVERGSAELAAQKIVEDYNANTQIVAEALSESGTRIQGEDKPDAIFQRQVEVVDPFLAQAAATNPALAAIVGEDATTFQWQEDPELTQILRDQVDLTDLLGKVESAAAGAFEVKGGIAGLEFIMAEGGARGGGGGGSLSSSLKKQWDAFISRASDVQSLQKNQEALADVVRSRFSTLAGPFLGAEPTSFEGPVGFASQARDLLEQQQSLNFGIGFGGGGTATPSPVGNPLPLGVGFDTLRRGITGGSPLPSSNPLSGGLGSQFAGAVLGSGNAPGVPGFQGGTDPELPEGIEPGVKKMIGRPSIHLPTFALYLQQQGRLIQ